MAVASRLTTRTAADTIRRELAADDTAFALRMVVMAVLDIRAILAAGDAAAIDDFVVPPQTTGSRRWDVLLGSAVGRELRLAEVHRPNWARPPALHSFWYVDPTPLLRARTMQRTAPDLACVGIWLDDAAFRAP
ncbi:MAG: hypothetical protein M3137_17875 [Actinomycetota bacterium]|nr:hypothetical protein [Actinomycetota bacterium]